MSRQADFNEFLGRIELDERQEKRIQSAVDTLTEFLISKLGLDPSDIIIQGSWANGTAIKPDPERADGEYDVDVVALCARAGMTPEQALAELRAGPESDGRFRDRIEPDPDGTRPCIRLRYAADASGAGFHVDVVPARRTGVDSPPIEIPRPGRGWKGSNPERYCAWCKARGEIFARIVRMLKRWRDHNQSARTAIKSIVLQVMIAERIEPIGDDADQIARILDEIAAFLAQHPDRPPVIRNPVLASENLTETWPIEDYRQFCRVVRGAADVAQEAAASSSLDLARERWQQLFGQDFPAPRESVGAEIVGIEQDLERDFKIKMARGWGSVTINAHVKADGNAPGGPLSSFTVLPKRRDLEFRISTSVPEPYRVYWKVRNGGDEARRQGALRGEIIRDYNGRRAFKKESTLYTGDHYVEVYVVTREGVCVASDRVDVVIGS